MENTLNGKELLPGQGSSLMLGPAVETDDHNWIVTAAANPKAANCPECGVPSTAATCGA
ncbi:MAG: hypothetical protein WA324_15780 [Bryobacteraceae bacterium]